jgi:hypothetical protein
MFISVNRIYKDLIPIDFDMADEEYLELVHPATHIQKIKDIIFNPKGTKDN